MAVAFPVAIPGTYDYEIPPELRRRLTVGTPVLVDVRNRRIWGVVVQVKARSEVPNLKPVIEAKTGRWADSSQSLLKLYRWVADYYQCDLGRVFRPLVNKGIISVQSKEVVTYSVTAKEGSPSTELQAAALEKIRSCSGPVTTREIEYALRVGRAVVGALCRQGFLEKRKITVTREADELAAAARPEEVVLTDEQRRAVEMMEGAMGDPRSPFLLHGITGSGKTHVYTALAAAALRRGQGVIILVPEISLTPQTIQRFRSAIGDVMTVIHSHMSDGERRDSIQELVTGRKRVVIGVRSAVLAPMDNVGLIIVDEEHDGSYKQSDLDPRYNARDVAVMRGKLQRAVVVLGSATPSLESYHNALSGKYQLIRLLSRFGPARLPRVEICDMTEEHKENNWTMLSRYLSGRIRACLDSKRQVILLLNRRGFSTVLICKDCGHTYMCPNCSVTLRYHRSDQVIKCHQCGHEQAAPDRCSSCSGEQIKYKGTGIQKAEEFLREQFPDARILRMDQDTTRRKGSHISILGAFSEGQADILLGTQMVSKGLNFPRVALVGVLQADTGLHFPDFRASERTFQLLTQVAGRAGRSDDSGEVVIQTYCPGDAAIRSASLHDYQSFFENEIGQRRELEYPPFGKVARVVVEGPDLGLVRDLITRACGLIKAAGGVTVLGPAPAVLSRIDRNHRFSMLLKSQSPSALNRALTAVRRGCTKLPHGLRLQVDVDPQNML